MTTATPSLSDAALDQLFRSARYVFVRSAEAKAKLQPALSAGNVAQTLAAPVCVIVAQDTRFYEHLPQQFPGYDARPLF